MPRPRIKSADQMIKISTSVDPGACEDFLSQLPSAHESSLTVRLPSQFGAKIFGDIWVAILIGTICRRQYSGLRIVASGHRELRPGSTFANSLPGLTAIQLSDRVRTEGNQPVDIDEIEYEVSHRRNGILESNSGKARTLIEFDPQNPIAVRLQAQTPKARGAFFGNLILEFRRVLELGYLHQDRPVWSTGNAPADITKFLSELHENAFKYSRTTVYDNQSLRGLRVVRIKAHLAASRDDLLLRAPEDSPIRTFLEQSAKGKGAHGVMEAIVSDFGNGIVDHFLSSQRGTAYRNYDRRQVLNELIHGRLSSSNDPGAGLGIKNALEAAKSIGAFVSVRTGEFWLARSFSDSAAREGTPVLKDVNGNRSKVAGTHWQFLWPMGI